MRVQEPDSPPAMSGASMSFSGPPFWQSSAPYQVGDLVQSAGSVWRSEMPHRAGADAIGAPSYNLHLWTPIASNGVLPPRYTQPPPNQPSSSSRTSWRDQAEYDRQQADALPLPLPPRRPAAEPDTGTSSPSSTETVTPSSRARRGKGSKTEDGEQDTISSFAAQAAQVERSRVAQFEQQGQGNAEVLQQELEGERFWRTSGAGVLAYSPDERAETTKAAVYRDWADTSGMDDWLRVARARRSWFGDGKGLKPLLQWRLVEQGMPFPEDALPIGHEADGAILYAARAWMEGGMHLGKAGRHLVRACSISYAGSEYSPSAYEVLCGPADPKLVKWMTYRHGERAGVGGWQPVEGGREKSGHALLVAKGEYEQGEHPGKCLINDDHICVGYGGGEVWVRPFQILAYCSPTYR